MKKAKLSFRVPAPQWEAAPAISLYLSEFCRDLFRFLDERYRGLFVSDRNIYRLPGGLPHATVRLSTDRFALFLRDLMRAIHGDTLIFIDAVTADDHFILRFRTEQPERGLSPELRQQAAATGLLLDQDSGMLTVSLPFERQAVYTVYAADLQLLYQALELAFSDLPHPEDQRTNI